MPLNLILPVAWLLGPFHGKYGCQPLLAEQHLECLFDISVKVPKQFSVGLLEKRWWGMSISPIQ